MHFIWNILDERYMTNYDTSKIEIYWLIFIISVLGYDFSLKFWECLQNAMNGLLIEKIMIGNARGLFDSDEMNFNLSLQNFGWTRFEKETISLFIEIFLFVTLI